MRRNGPAVCFREVEHPDADAVCPPRHQLARVEWRARRLLPRVVWLKRPCAGSDPDRLAEAGAVVGDLVAVAVADPVVANRGRAAKPGMQALGDLPGAQAAHRGDRLSKDAAQREKEKQ